MIKFACGSCGKKLGIADTEAGLSVKCPQCGTKLRVPGERKPGAAAPAPPPKPPPRKPLDPEEAEALTEEIAEPPGPDAVQTGPPRKPARKPPKEKEDEDEEREEDEERPAKAKARKRRRDEEEDEEEEDERPRAKKKRRRRDEEEDEDEERDEEDDWDDEKGVITPNRIRGVVAILCAGGVVAAALLVEKFQDPDFEYIRYVFFGIAGLMVAAGIYYLIKG
jgi:DNA-directed RNA polymerase subunit RPC12/RpoP